MIAVVRQFPVRSALLAITLVALIVAMWTAWPFGTGIATSFVLQAIYLAEAYYGRRPESDRAKTSGHEGLRG